MKTIVALLFFVLICPPVQGATYYVKSDGNDSAAGTSDATAWATPARVQATSGYGAGPYVADGDTIYFCSQDTWNAPGTVTNGARILKTYPRTNITYDGKTYTTCRAGTQQRAVFKASGDQATGYVAQVSLSSNNVTFRGFDVDGQQWITSGIVVGGNSYDNAGNDVVGVTIDDVIQHDNGDPNAYNLPDNPVSVTVTFDSNYTYFTKSSDGTDWSNLSVRGGVNRLWKSDTSSYVKWSGFSHSALNGTWFQVVNVTANVITVYLVAGSANETATVSGQYRYAGYFYGIAVQSFNSPPTQIKNVQILNSVSYNTGGEAIALYQSWMYPGNHTDGVLVRNCTMHDTGLSDPSLFGNGIVIANYTDNVTVEFSNIYNSMYGVWVRTSWEVQNVSGGPQNMVLRYNLIHDNYSYGIILVNPAGSQTGATPTTVTGDIYGNLIWNTGATCTGGAWDFYIGEYHWNASSIKVYNNSFFNSVIPSTCTNGSGIIGVAKYGASGWSAPAGTFLIKNNVLYSTSPYLMSVLYDESHHVAPTSISYGYNLVRNESSDTAAHVYFWPATPYDRRNNDLITHWDSTAKEGNPLFTGGAPPTYITGTSGPCTYSSGWTCTYVRDMAPNAAYFATSTGDTIGTGASLGYPYDGSINQAGLASPQLRPAGAYDIGAYQYYVVPPPTSGTAIADLTDGGPTITLADAIPIQRGQDNFKITVADLLQRGLPVTNRKDTLVAGGTCSGSYTPDLSAGNFFTLTLNGSCVLNAPTNLAPGKSLTLQMTQTGTNRPAFASAYKWQGGTMPTWSNSATKYDTVQCKSLDGSTLQCSGLVDVR